ncbi:Uncharacterised protein [Mannheimia haemolytica]|uniref:Uncharacterized protein n=1 Tax=Mannheimia haemolytica TaxID=75985 RepID=A0A378N1V2_MANHA|nr:Uncharacterised protein [Mannheimia haemolytica]
MFVFPADIKKSIKSNYQREYNFIFIIVGLSTIIGIILTILSSFLLLNYLVSIDARNLFINSLNSNFSTIFIPIALFLFFPIMLMNMQPIKYYLSLEKNKYKQQVNDIRYYRNSLYTSSYSHSVFSRNKPESNFNQFTYSRCIYLSTI